MIAFKHKSVRGQRASTRLQTVIDRIHNRVRAAAEKYRAARHAKYALAGEGEWEKVLRVLHDGDICGYQDPNCLRVHVGRRGTLEDGQVEAVEVAADVMMSPRMCCGMRPANNVMGLGKRGAPFPGSGRQNRILETPKMMETISCGWNGRKAGRRQQGAVKKFSF